MPALAAPPPFGAGDWTVGGNETLADRALLLAGNLVIRPGGSLTLLNASLIVYSSFPEEHEIRVMSGGTLRVLDNSTVSAFDPVNTFGFWLDEGSVAVFSDSTFLACGIRYREVAQQITGGITSRTDSLYIDNCTFAGAHVAMTGYTPLRLTNSSFISNYIGIIAISSEVELENCSFLGNTLLGAWVYRCLETSGTCAIFRNCTFINNSVGIASDESTCDIADCYFARNTGSAVWASAMMQWYIGPSELGLRECLFEDNAIGIGHYPDVGSNKLNITDCDFLDNQLALDWENDGDTGNPPPGISFWNSTRPCLARNNRFLFNGNVTVMSGGALDLSGSNLTFDSDFDGESGLLVEGGGLVELANGSLLRMHWGSGPYALRCLPGSTFRMADTLLRDCGWNSTSPGTAGPFFEGASVEIGSSTIDYNPVGLVFQNGTGAIVRDTRLRGLETAVSLNGSSAVFENSTLGHVVGPSAVLNGSSLLDCVNSTIDRWNLSFRDAASRANLSWYLGVRAFWADGSPAAGASLSVRDALGEEVANGTMDDSGRLSGLVVREASLALSGGENLTPHIVRCSRGAVYNETRVTVDRSRELTLVLTDREAPTVNIAFPGPEAYLSSGTVFVNGTASDNLAVDRVELLVDGFRRLEAYSSDGLEETLVEWNVTLGLLEGPHSVEARSYDAAGNFASATVFFSVDFSAPRVRIAWPPDGHLTNLSVLGVSGYMEPGCRVLLGSAEVKTLRDTFEGTVILGEGENLVTATAIDRAGNANTSSVTVTLDTRPPALDVLWPPDGLGVNIPVVAVNGTVEPGASVYVNGRAVALPGAPGSFRTAVSLSRTVSYITVDAVDPAGNHNVTVRRVVLDTVPPPLSLSHPPEGLVTNMSALMMSGSSEGGALLSINGRVLLVPGEPGLPSEFAVPLDLAEGPNTIFLSAEDPAGNLNSTVRHVFLDTTPPPLSISSPGDGEKTSAPSVFIVGTTEPGALVTVNGRPVPVGITGSFSFQAALDPGTSRFTVRAEDGAGNVNTTRLSVQRLPAAGGDLITEITGPDWAFLGFLLLAAVAGGSEGYLASRYFRRKRGVRDG